MKEHPGTSGILWDYKSPYYSWGIFAGAGAYIWGKNDGTYNLTDIGVNNAGAIEALSDILGLVKSGVLPNSVSYSTAEDKMSQGKLAMMISGPRGVVQSDQNRDRLQRCARPGLQRQARATVCRCECSLYQSGQRQPGNRQRIRRALSDLRAGIERDE